MIPTMQTINFRATWRAAQAFGVALLVMLALAAAILMGALHSQPSTTHAATQRTANANAAGDCYYDPTSGQVYCDNYTPPVYDPGTGGWTGPYGPGIYDPSYTPPVFDPGTGGWTGPYGPGIYDPSYVPPVWDPGTGGWTD